VPPPSPQEERSQNGVSYTTDAASQNGLVVGSGGTPGTVASKEPSCRPAALWLIVTVSVLLPGGSISLAVAVAVLVMMLQSLRDTVMVHEVEASAASVPTFQVQFGAPLPPHVSLT
jgi:hypothetical protein